MNKVLFTSTLGVGLLTVETIPVNVKLAIACIALTPSLVVLAKGYRKYSKVQDKLKQSISKRRKDERELLKQWEELNRQKRDVESIFSDLDAERSELAALRVQYALDKEQAIAKALSELEAAKKKLEAESDKRVQEIAALEVQSNLLLEKERQKIATEQAIKANELEQKREAFEAEKKLFEELFQSQNTSQSEWMEAQRSAWEKEKAIALQQLEKQREIFEQEKTNYEQIIKTQNDNFASQLLAQQRLWEQQKQAEKEQLDREILAQKQKCQAEINEIKRKFDEELIAERAEFDALIEEERDAIFKEWEETNKKAIKATVVKHLKPAQDKIAQLERKLQETTARLRLSDEEIRKLNKPPKIKGMEPHNLIARRFQEFYEERSLDIEITNAIILEGYTILRFKIWHRQSLSKIKECLVELMDEFKLQDEPKFGVTLDGYEIQMMPVNAPYMGGKPKTNVLHHEMERLYHLTNENLPSDDAEYPNQEVREAIASQLHAEKMLSFIEPDAPLDRPVPGTDITELEITYVEFLSRWRQRATGKPCLTTQNDLLRRVWGVSPGRGTDTDIEGESLRDRLKKILDLLNIKYRTKNKEQEKPS